MRYGTLQGTFVKVGSEVASIPLNYFLGQSVVFTTNDLPKTFKEKDSGFIGSFNTLEEIQPYYDEENAVYQSIKWFLRQQGQKSIANVDFRYAVYYKEGSNATSAYLTTTDIGDRLANFAPMAPQVLKKCVLSISIDGVIEKKTIEIYKPLTTLDVLVEWLNNAGFSCEFKKQNDEIKVTAPLLGSNSNIAVVATADVPNDCVDIATSDYLNLIGATAEVGTDDNGNDFINDIPELISKGKTITLLVATQKVRASTLKKWEDDLINLSQTAGRYIPLINAIQSKKENLLFASLLSGYQSLFITTPCVGYGDNVALQLQGGLASAVCSRDYGALNTRRYDPEWDTIDIDNDALANYQGFNNNDINELRESGIGGLCFYSEQYKKLMYMGNNHGWSITERCAYSAIAEEVMIATSNHMIYTTDKTRATESLSSLKIAVNSIDKVFKDNGYLTNNVDTTHPSFLSLTTEQQEALTTDGYCVDNLQIQDNNILFDNYICLNGIIASIKINQKVFSN